MWLGGGQVRGGWLLAIMLKTRAEYKHVSRWVVRNQEKLVAGRMADALCENRSRDLWSEIKRVKGSNCRQSNVINGAVGSDDSCQVFNETYKSLYQSVPSSESELSILYEELNTGIRDKCQSGACYSDHCIRTADVLTAVAKLKPGKSDAIPDLTFYAFQFIDLSAGGFQALDIAWKKCVRRIFKMPPRTRSNLYTVYLTNLHPE
ncbi:hypothetical protein CAPTEDRAFT_196852 [Capitella teleta]|uniref:Uncharacterized protein n=1 Tax=Capitella teleta TaxID=283909 RepID=R7VGF1_CAPTE|nr:hypothetical protein CAPTEDRAFT_196852 [Capitella teleta]|eukprot:ELU17928.1 hypothetical protein CAPTEDRAFT_196852 [Capitella teleta]